MLYLGVTQLPPLESSKFCESTGAKETRRFSTDSLESPCGTDLCWEAGWRTRDPQGWAGLRVGWGKSLVGPGELCGETLPYEGLGAGAWVESPRGGNPEAPGRLRPQGGRTGRTGGSQRLPSEMGQVSPERGVWAPGTWAPRLTPGMPLTPASPQIPRHEVRGGGLWRLELVPEAVSWMWTIDTSRNRNLDRILTLLVSSSCHASIYTFVNGKRSLRE